MMRIYSTLCILLLSMMFEVKSQEFTQLTNLPTFYITTTAGAPITSTDVWVTGNVTIVSNDSVERVSNAAIEIRGRGNATWRMAKKSYRIKFGKKTRLLNMPAKEKDWVLLANYADKTLMRNAVAFEIGKQLGMEYTPPVKYADVFLNGTFLGNYLITDQLEVNENRVPVEKQDTFMTTLPNITGGYLLEINGLLDTVDDPVYVKTAKGLNVIVKYPKDDDINAEQKAYISNFVTNFESSLFSANSFDSILGYRNLVDTASIVNWYLACELTGNSDSFWSTYMYKKRNIDKLFFGPLWDYDIAFNNDFRLGDATQKLMRIYAHDPKTWITQFTSDDWFLKKVYNRFLEVKSSGLLQHLLDYIDQNAANLNSSQQQNFSVWNILNTTVYLELATRGTYAAEVAFLKNYLTSRFGYLETALKTVENPYSSQVNTSYYYNIINKRNGKAIDIQNASTTNSAKTVLYTLDSNKLSQQWRFIKAGTDNVYYVINRGSGKALQNDGYRSSQLFQYTFDASSGYQQWEIVPVDANYAGLRNTLSSQYSINNKGGSSADGNPIIQYTNNITGSENQQWGFVKLSPITTGIEDVKYTAPIVNIYPNPVDERTTIYCNLPGATSVHLSIFSNQGVLLYDLVKTDIESSECLIDLSVRNIGLTPGVYILRLTTNDGLSTSSKLIIR